MEMSTRDFELLPRRDFDSSREDFELRFEDTDLDPPPDFRSTILE